MKCFVMPFEERFDDVYTQIKQTVEAGLSGRQARCFRLDESRPSGRITERLLTELNQASLCIADVTGNRPNVMWEVGYAMALGKPTILLTQDVATLPFDIRDMQAVEYDREHLSQSLAPVLKRVLIDSIEHYESVTRSGDLGEHDHVVRLSQQIEQLKAMVAGAIELSQPKVPSALPTAQPAEDSAENQHSGFPALEGHWTISTSASHLYGRVVDGQLIAPYCYQGNDKLTAVFFDFRRANEYWFARFAWFDSDITGFAFIKQQSPKLFTGAWWGDESAGADLARSLGQPPERSGEPLEVRRAAKQNMPGWANEFFVELERYGLVKTFLTKSQGRKSLKELRRLF